MSEHASGKDPVGPIAPQIGPNLVAIPNTPIKGAGILPEFSLPAPEGPDRLVFRVPRRWTWDQSRKATRSPGAPGA
jgi:hypothetical protein